MNILKILINIIFLTLVLMIVLKAFIFLLPAILFIIAAVLIMNAKLIKQVAATFKEKKEFRSVPGRTYKVCGCCDRKADRHASVCTFCGKTFE